MIFEGNGNKCRTSKQEQLLKQRNADGIPLGPLSVLSKGWTCLHRCYETTGEKLGRRKTVTGRDGTCTRELQRQLN